MLHIQDSPYIKSFHFDDSDTFIESVSHKGELYNLLDDNFIFRGHSTDRYKLCPSALRGFLVLDNIRQTQLSKKEQKLFVYLATTELAQIQKEYKLLQDFFNSCDKNGLYVPHIESLRNSFCPGIDVEALFFRHKWLPKEYWELAALAQHHGVKTRLLDWTHDIHVALYFASTGVFYDPKEKIDIIASKKAYREGGHFSPKHDMEIWALDTGVVMTKPAQMPLHIVQPQYHNNDNLCAQKGIFTFWESMYPGFPKKDCKLDINTQTDRQSLDEQLDSYLKEERIPEKPYLYLITIPQDAAYGIYSHLEKMGYNASTLFPGYDGVARYLKEHREILKKE